MARRIPLPRLTQRQRLARWQRERRQQAIVVVVFSAILFFVLGLASWAAADRFYEANLRPAATYAGRLIPMRDYTREKSYQLVKFYVDFGVPPGFEDHPQVLPQKAEYDRIALERLIEQAALDHAARGSGIQVSRTAIDERYALDLGQYKARHVLITPKADAADKEAADKEALGKAADLATQLRAAPHDQQLWNKLAEEHSDDPGSKTSGGELGFVGRGQFVKEFEDAAAKLALGAVSDPVKSQFGYHVIQLQERKTPEDSDLVKRILSSGFTVEDVKAHVRYDILHDEITKREQERAIGSPTEQVRLAQILVNIPRPRATDFTAFSEGLRKISEVTSELDKGTDFAEVAKKLSEDRASAEAGGDIGWFVRGMIVDPAQEAEVFALDAGARSRQFSTASQALIYKVLEKDGSRALTDEQKAAVKGQAYVYWFAREKRTNGARILVSGLGTD